MWLSLVGPTATGKTNLALVIAQQLLSENVVTEVDLISADSRQVYQGLEIVSGVDIPAHFSLVESEAIPYYQNETGQIKIWGVSMIKPDQEWSVAHFQSFAQQLIMQADAPGRLAIVVGGTGLYQSQIVQTDPTLHVPPNSEVRDRAELLSLAELQTWLQKTDASRWQKMNQSDQQNPRRLVRALEISVASQAARPVPVQIQASLPPPLLTVGLTDTIEAIEKRIAQRVKDRFQAGAANEVERLVQTYDNLRLPIYSTTGVKLLIAFNNQEIDLATLLDKWTTQERQYAKRQITWYQKRPDINWFNRDEQQLEHEVIDLIRTSCQKQ